jgi:putative sigma-54 modulation protein
MQINFIGRHLEVTPGLRSYTEEKMQKLHIRDDQISTLDIKFSIENITHKAEGTIHLPGTELHATAQADEMYAAIDLLVDKLAAILTKHKEKHVTHR